MKKEIKNIFQKSIEEHASFVDAQELLAGIAAKRKKKKERKFILWFFQGLLLLTGAVAALVIHNNESIQIDQQVLEVASDKKDDVVDVSNTAIIPEEKIVETQKNLIIEHTQRNDPSRATDTKRATDTRSGVDFEANASQTRVVPEFAVPENDVAITKHKGFIAEGNPENDERSLESTASTVKTTKDLHQSTGSENKESSQGNKTKADKEQLVAKSSMPPSPTEDASDDSQQFVIEEPKVNEVSLQEEVEKATVDETPIATDESTSLKRQNKWTLTMLFGGGLLASDYGTSDIAAQRLESLSQGFSLSSHFGVSYQLPKGIQLSTGLEYSHYSQLFQWSGQYIADRDGVFVGREIPSNLQAEEYILIVKDRQLVKYNSRAFVDIPLALSLRKEISSWVVEPFASVAFNILDTQNGYAVNENGIPQTLNTYAYKLSPKVGLGLDVEWRFSESWGLVGRTAYYRRKIGDGVEDEVVRTPQMSVGLRYGL